VTKIEKKFYNIGTWSLASAPTANEGGMSQSKVSSENRKLNLKRLQRLHMNVHHNTEHQHKGKQMVSTLLNFIFIGEEEYK